MFFNLKSKTRINHAINNPVESALSSRQSQRGMSNVALGITLIVGAIIVFGGIKMLPKITDSKINSELDTIGTFKTKTVDYGQFTPIFTTGNVSISVLQGLGFFPPNTTSGSGSSMVASNQWGGTTTPSVGTVVTAGDSITFTDTSYPQAACNSLGLKLDSLAEIVTINTVVTKAAGASTVAATVATSCTPGNSNTIAYTLSR